MRIDNTIHKVEFKPADKMELEVPIGSRVVHIAEQDEGRIWVWYERPLISSGTKIVNLFCFGTGDTIDITNLGADYFKTVVMRNHLVWHFYIRYGENRSSAEVA